ncbi:MAG: FAD/NAD(P)-binding oxidoreductase [Sulfurospirillum sp.]
MNNVQIAIVGAGPAGISAALELKKLGYSDLIVFEREDEIGGTPRHCGHLGFGIFEFKRILSGPDYAKKLASLASQNSINIQLKSTLTKIEDGVLTFSTPDGVKQYEPTCTLFALGARETPRPDRLVSGTRSPNIITTGTLQRFAYLQKIKPFDRAVIIGSEIVSFSAIMSAKHAGIKIEAIIEEKDKIDTFCIVKYMVKYLLKIPVLTNTKLKNINGEDKKVISVTVSTEEGEREIPCDGVIFTGQFIPESSIMQKSFDDFNLSNNSLYISQNFQAKNDGFFVAGNALRGALAAFKCYFEGKKVAKSIHDFIRFKHEPELIKIEADENLSWYYPSMIDLKSPTKQHLTALRLKKRAKGVIKVLLNGRMIYKKNIHAFPFMSINIPWKDIELKPKDVIKLEFVSN